MHIPVALVHLPVLLTVSTFMCSFAILAHLSPLRAGLALATHTPYFSLLRLEGTNPIFLAHIHILVVLLNFYLLIIVEGLCVCACVGARTEAG